MVSTIAVPMMSTMDSSQYVRSPSHTTSHQRSSQRLTHPFGLARIPSERLDPRSDSYHGNPKTHESGQKRAEHGNMNNASFKTNGANGPISAPSLSTNGQLSGISKPAGATIQDTEASGSFQSQGHGFPYVNAKAESSAAKMVSRST